MGNMTNKVCRLSVLAPTAASPASCGNREVQSRGEARLAGAALHTVDTGDVHDRSRDRSRVGIKQRASRAFARLAQCARSVSASPSQPESKATLSQGSR